VSERVRLDDMALTAEGAGTRFAASVARVGEALGLTWLGATLYEVPPGKTALPFHRHHTSDEMFVVLSGSGEYRYGETRTSFQAGDVLGAPAAGEGHQITNTGEVPLRYLAIANHTNADVVEYLDSGRIHVDVGATGWHRNDGTFKQGGRLTPMGYWDGEKTGDDK
jgi:uncharacterized cupin superfamily protein